ncbi:MAG: acetate kinase [Bacilli bacterium]|nr:acetate kinase [Bacilli bacterium]
MNEKYLVINAGSSSLKFSLYEMPEEKEIVNGYVERIGNEGSCYSLKYNGNKIQKEKLIMSHVEAVQIMLQELLQNNFISDLSDIKGVGHRVLHGAEKYSDSVIIDDSVLNDIVSLTELGPLHHPGQIDGIKAMQECLPGVPQVAVYDTAFHQTMPIENYLYATPYEWYEKDGVRKYGFHGTSHKYITETMKEHYGTDNVNLIICHLGSGASMCCVKNGKSIDTTMGFTPLAGLIMGTRSGDIDPSIIPYIMKKQNKTINEVIDDLNKKSGLLGIASKNDFRDICAMANNGNTNAQLAFTKFKKSVVKQIADYYFQLNGKVDAIIFTAGIGENTPSIREAIVNEISNPMNIKLNKESNNNIASFKEQKSGKISTNESSTDVLVIPTNEELMIALDTYRLSKENNKDNNKTKVYK